MEISTNNFDIISNGSIIVSKDDIVSFDFKESELYFKISFKNEEENNEGRIEYHINNAGNGFLDIFFINMKKPMFASPSQKLKVAKDKDGKQWYAFLSVQAISDGNTYILFYTWFKDK